MSNVKQLDSGLIVYKNRKIAYDNGTTIYIENTARRDFDAADHEAFDSLVYSDKKPKTYIASLNSQFDWKKQYDSFMRGEFPEGVTFTQEEAKVLQTLESVKAKIKAAFELPSIPYTPVEGIDLRKEFPLADDDAIAAASSWLNGEGTAAAAPGIIRRSNNNRIFLRLHTSASGNQSVYNNNGHRIGVRTFTRIFNTFLKPYWAGERTNQYGPSVSGYESVAYANSVSIGCQRHIPRSEVERIANQLGLI